MGKLNVLTFCLFFTSCKPTYSGARKFWGHLQEPYPYYYRRDLVLKCLFDIDFCCHFPDISFWYRKNKSLRTKLWSDKS